uniref:Uncharacterized protein n=1 Tax=Phlebotomus papatasi TaxID=29031 RepID=A0A1B0D2U8_PHLPP
MLFSHVLGLGDLMASAQVDGLRKRAASYLSECQFGKQLKELGSSWFPDLGPPFGVMYCFRCECVAVQKKRRIVAKVECRSMKYDCPKVTCDDPVILPGKCCKTCPGDNAIY